MSKKAHNIGKKKDLVRSVHAGHLPCDCPVARRLIDQRLPLIAWCTDLAALLFRPNPLVKTTPGTQARAEDLAKGSPWFSGYAQALAGNVATRINAVEKHLRRRLLGWLKGCDEATKPKRGRKRAPVRPKPAEGPPRRFICVPVAVQDSVTSADFKALKILAEQDKTCWSLFAELRTLELILTSAGAKIADAEAGYRRIFQRHGLNTVQGAIVREIVTSAFARYTCPVFNRLDAKATDRFKLRLELDARGYADMAFRNKPNAFRAYLNAAMEVAWARGEKRFATEITVLDPAHRQGAKLPHLTIPVSIHRGVWLAATKLDKLSGREPTLANACLEIGPDTVEVKVGIRLERITPDIALTGRLQRHKATDDYYKELEVAVNRRRVLLGRDIGMINTVALGAVLRSRAVSADELRSATFLTREGALERLTSHVHPAKPANLQSLFAEPETAARLAMLDEKSRKQLQGPNPRRFCGRDFLDCIARHGAVIDTLREEIDENYKKLKKLKTALLKPLDLASAKARITDAYRPIAGKSADIQHPDPFIQSLIDKFFRILDLTLQLKELRRDQYRKVDAVKKCWFGWVSTREAMLAWVLEAVVVREGGGYQPIGLDDPKYKGRAFNRMIANASRALYEAAASGKLAWLGIPELRAPSFHTSAWDMRFAVVDKTMRKGEVFVGVDGQRWHADEHASLGIAVWHLLVPVANMMKEEVGLEENLVPA